MAKGPEGRFKARFNAQLKTRASWIARCSMADAAMSCVGIPDFYYDGPNDLWVEFKVVKSMKSPVIADYSAPQLIWLRRRSANGGNAIGIVEMPDKRVTIQVTDLDRIIGTSNLLNIKEAVQWVINFCGNSAAPSSI